VSIGTTIGRRAAATTLPFVPGDSILEAFRLATARDTPVAFVDRYVHTTPKERADRSRQLPGAELAARTSSDYLAVVDGLLALDPVGPASLAREAVMARHLAALMEQHKSVLWVGGLGIGQESKRGLHPGISRIRVFDQALRSAGGEGASVHRRCIA
jgi:pheromone shutdown protein TraB